MNSGKQQTPILERSAGTGARKAVLLALSLPVVLGLWLFLAGLGALAQPAVGLAPPSGDVAPGFWDLRRRMEKPDLGALRLLRFITEDDYPPFDFVAPDGALMGFNVELARAVCEELRLQCTVQPRRWDTILDTLEKGGADAAIASLAINARNRARADFSAPYYKTPGRFVARTSVALDPVIPETLGDRVVGVEAGTAHEAFLRDMFPRVRRRAFETATALRAAIRRGEVDMIFGDGVALALWLNGVDSAGCCAFRGGPFLQRAYFGDGVGIAVARGNISLRRALDYALQRLAERGVYAELYLKYFPIGFF
jgi:polar amino acid transport system substrate-binding protein